MKRKIGKINRKIVVTGDKNTITRNEIHAENASAKYIEEALNTPC